MRALVQRVEWAAVGVDGEEVARIGPGMLVLVSERSEGVFGATMAVELVNDGPVTLMVEV